jgi:hypothetical protein
MLIIIWIIGSFVAAWVAHDKGRNGLKFFLLALLASPLIGILAAIGCRPHDLPSSSGYMWSINRSFSKPMQMFLVIAAVIFMVAWLTAP